MGDKIRTWLGIVSLLFALLGSWTHFYSRQQLHDMSIKELKRDKKELTKVVYSLNTTQATLVEAVSNNSINNKELREDFKGLLGVLNKNQSMLTILIAKEDRHETTTR